MEANNNEPIKRFTVDVAKPEDALGAQMVFYRTWLDTYPNEEVGISIEDVKDRFADRITSNGITRMAESISNPKPDTLFLVAKGNNEVVGVCRLKKDEEVNELGAIYVLPEYQGNGIGTYLWNEALKFFDSEKDIVVKVADYNIKAIKFYQKLGFVDTGKKFTDEMFRFKSGAIIPEMEMVLRRSK